MKHNRPKLIEPESDVQPLGVKGHTPKFSFFWYLWMHVQLLKATLPRTPIILLKTSGKWASKYPGL